MKFLLFAASHRPESHNKKLVQLAAEAIKAAGHSALQIEYAKLDMPIYDDHLATTQPHPSEASRLLTLTADCDGIVIASPEYNWSMPGSLKNIIDWTSKVDINGLAGKTALLLSASPSSRGGVVGLTHLRTSLECLHVHVFNRVYALENSHIGFDDLGQIENEARKSQLGELIANYVTYTAKLTNTSS